jgi:hypothetical protein
MSTIADKKFGFRVYHNRQNNRENVYAPSNLGYRFFCIVGCGHLYWSCAIFLI